MNLTWFRRVSLLVLAWGVTVACGQTVDLAIIHWNDFHAYNDYTVTSRGDTVGGYGYLAAYRDSLVALHPGRAISLHGGDDFQGTPVSNLTRGASQIRLLNLVQPDAFVLGNHEFDYGRKILDSLLQHTTFPVLSANILDTLSGEPFATPYILLPRDGVTVGVIGLSPPDLYELSLPSNVAGLKILDKTTTVQTFATSIGRKADLTVVLSHMGIWQDSLLAVSLPNDTPVDLIVGGHSHTKLTQYKKVNGIYIVQAGDHGQFLGHFIATVDTADNAITQADYSLVPIHRKGRNPNAEIQVAVDSLEQAARKELNRVIGHLKTPWRRSRQGESNIGNWQTDVMRQYAEADIALQNSGGIRKNLAAGPIRIRDLWEINPFGNHFIRFTISGKQLEQVVRHQIEDPQEFLQLSGLEYTWNTTKQKFTRIRVNQKRIRPRWDYTIVTNNYVFSHFRKFFGLDPGGIKNVEHLPDIDRDVFVRAAQQQDTIVSRVEQRVLYIQ